MIEKRTKYLFPAGILGLALLAAGVLLAAAFHSPVLGASDGQAKRLSSRQLQAALQNNLGVAYMNRESIQKAIGYFQRAYALDPQLTAARLNEAIALQNTQKYAQALAILRELTRQEPHSPHVWYNLGQVEMDTNHPRAALQAFERVARMNPHDADTRYFIGKLHMQLRQYPQAIASLEAALRINPFHVSAEFALAQTYQRSGNIPEARKHLALFQHYTEAKLGQPLTLVYGQQGIYSQVIEASTGREAVPPAVRVHFVNVTKSSGLPPTAAPSHGGRSAATAAGYFGSGACVFDSNGDGRPDILLLDANGAPALYRNEGDGHFANVTKSSGISIPGPGIGCTVGDFNNDHRPDLAISYNGGIALFQNEGSGKFLNVTRQAGIRTTGLVLGLTFVDYDHDGDLDLYASRFPDVSVNRRTGALSLPRGRALPANVLWRNDGNGKFTNVTEAANLRGPGLGVGALLSDVNNDRAVDLVLTGYRGAPVVYLNPREGRFRPERPWASRFSSPTRGVASLDFNKDGWMDLAFTQAGAPGLSLWRNVDGKKFLPVALPHLDWTRAWGVSALDYDNDGWVDLVAVGDDAHGGHIALFRNDGPKGFRNVTRQVGLDKIHLAHPRSVVAADFYGDGSTDLLVTQNDGPPVLLRNVGGNHYHWLDLQLSGTNDNRSGLGTKVQVFAGALHQKWEITGASGYLSQGPLTLTAGLGSHTHPDIVRMLWPTGVLQDEVHIAAGQAHLVDEIDRRGSSCPLLFAWDGRHFHFVSDILGPGIVGHWIAPGKRNIPDPVEYVKVDGSFVRPHDGRLSFRLLEPMEELDYLDQVRLLAVDHPAGVSVYPNSRFLMAPPFPRFRVMVSRGAHPPLGAWNGRGRNVLPLLVKKDHRFVEGFADTPFAGIAATHTLELDIGPWNPRRPLRLIMTGFTDYFSANSLYAAWQAHVSPIPPYIEALMPDGRWKRVVAEMGFPAGLERTMVARLTGHLPPGTRRIRIVTNLRIYWDRVLVDNAPRDVPYRVTPVPLAGARLDFRGYPRAVEGHPAADLSYVYDDVSATGPYARQMGNYTRYGNVFPLLTRADEEDVVFGSGDEVAIDFNPSSLPPLPHGWKRDYFFYANGFDKDMDFYAYDGSTVAPMPFHTLIPYPYPRGTGYPEDARHVRYRLEYNTRPVVGPAGNTYRFQYRYDPPR